MTGATSMAARLDDRGLRVLLLAATLLFLAVTASFYAIDSAEQGKSDVASYRPMAEAAPGLPDEDLGSVYTERIATHYVVGLVASGTGMGVDAAYVVVTVLVVLGLVAVLHLLLSGFGLALGPYALLAGLFLLNPYALRAYAIEIGRVQDLVLVLGLGVTLLGLLRVRPSLVVAGAVVAILGRQTALLVAPVVAAWTVAGPGWRERRDVPALRRFGLPALVLGLTVAIYVAVGAIVEPFSTPFEPSIPEDTVLDRLDELPGIAGELVAHVLRTLIPLVIAGGVLGGLLLAAGRRLRVPPVAWWSLAVVGAILAQPLLLDWDFGGFRSNEQRTGVLALLPLVVAVAAVAAARPVPGLTRGVPAVGVALLVLGSLHHVFTAIGPGSLGGFIALQMVAAAGLGVLTWRVAHRNAG